MDTVLSETPTVSYLRTRRCCSLGRVDVAVMWTYLVLLDIGLLFGVIDGPVFSLGVLAPNFGRSAFSVVGSQRYILARRRRAYSTSVLRKRKRGQNMPKKLVVAGNGCCCAMVVSDRWLGPVVMVLRVLWRMSSTVRGKAKKWRSKSLQVLRARVLGPKRFWRRRN